MGHKPGNDGWIRYSQWIPGASDVGPDDEPRSYWEKMLREEAMQNAPRPIAERRTPEFSPSTSGLKQRLDEYLAQPSTALSRPMAWPQSPPDPHTPFRLATTAPAKALMRGDRAISPEAVTGVRRPEFGPSTSELRSRLHQQTICPPVGPQTMGTITETENVLNHSIWDNLSAGSSALSAARATARRFPDNRVQHNDEADAYRHSLWSAELTRSIGDEAAKRYTDSHEASGGSPPQETAMDLYNNAVGRAMAQDPRFRELSPEEIAEIAYRNACLRLKLK